MLAFQCDVNGKSLEVTATIYIPIQGKLVCGREDGTIIVAPATQCIIYQLLDKKDLRQEGNTPGFVSWSGTNPASR